MHESSLLNDHLALCDIPPTWMQYHETEITDRTSISPETFQWIHFHSAASHPIQRGMCMK